MSQLIDKPRNRTATPTPRTKHRVGAPAEVAVPNVKLKAKVYRRERAKPGVVSIIANKVALFGVVMGITYGASSLMGQVNVEAARQDRLNAYRRAMEAEKAEAQLAVRVDRLSSSAAVDAYAISARMTPSGEAVAKPPREVRVASR